ncbi:MAG: TIR domain-containing protein [Phycisphaerales bacterium]|nr:TIR domain-containing protein [Hyphomonadaceae bacterium]
MADIFISYAHEDQSFVRLMVPALEAEGFSVWWDHSIPPGQSWDTFIAAGIRDAKAAIVVWSPHSASSDWVKEEATLARSGAKYLPVQIGGAAPPIGFQRIQAAQLSAWQGEPNNAQWQMLLRAAHELVGGERSEVIPAPGAARPSYYPSPASPPPAKKSSGAPVALIVVVALIALSGLGWWVVGRGPQVPIETTAATPLQTPAPVDTTAEAPILDPSQQQEIQQLRREREAAISAQRAADQRAENERQARLALEARQAADLQARQSVVGSWRVTGRWATATADWSDRWSFRSDTTVTLNSDADLGAWTQNGNRISVIYSGEHRIEYAITMTDDRFTGTMTANNGQTGTVHATRD